MKIRLALFLSPFQTFKRVWGKGAQDVPLGHRIKWNCPGFPVSTDLIKAALDKPFLHLVLCGNHQKQK